MYYNYYNCYIIIYSYNYILYLQDHDCHTDVATFTATKGHFVQGQCGNYFNILTSDFAVVYSSQQKARENQIKSFMKFKNFREMSEVSLHVFVDHDCHTDVTTFTATKDYFVQGGSGNYFAREK